MTKSFLLALVVAVIALGGCGGGNSTKSNKRNNASKNYEMKTAQASVFDEDIESFVLEQDDLFGGVNDNATLASNGQGLPFTWENAHEEGKESFKTVYFDYDSSRIPQTEVEKMSANKSKAQEFTQEGKTVVCKGKACKYRGTEAYNLALSDQRAQSVARELKKQGVPSDHIKAFGVGTKEAHSEGNSKAAHSKDRCVDLYTLSI
ncbi:MAG: OmpA family protein [Candidatus Babeliales bacterium]